MRIENLTRQINEESFALEYKCDLYIPIEPLQDFNAARNDDEIALLLGKQLLQQLLEKRPTTYRTPA